MAHVSENRKLNTKLRSKLLSTKVVLFEKSYNKLKITRKLKRKKGKF